MNTIEELLDWGKDLVRKINELSNRYYQKLIEESLLEQVYQDMVSLKRVLCYLLKRTSRLRTVTE